MTGHIKSPTRIASAGNKVKIIDEFIGLINSDSRDISIARMKSPSGWEEPAQSPEFDEYTFVIRGEVHVKTEEDHLVIKEDELFFARKGLRVQYSTPGPDGAEYIAICLPAFSPDLVHREN